MQPVNVENDECIPLAKIPMEVLDLVLEKMTFAEYFSFLPTGALAKALDDRNPNFKYPLDVDQFEIWSQLDNKPSTDHVGNWIVEFRIGKRTFSLWMEQCKKIRFSAVEVSILEKWYSKVLCDFLLDFDEILKLDCWFPYNCEPHTVEFFKKARIYRLKMETSEDYAIDSFPIDTSNIDNVEISDCSRMSREVIWSIKARRHIRLSDARITPYQVINHIEKVKTGSQVPDLTFVGTSMNQDEFIEFGRFLMIHGNHLRRGTFTLSRLDEQKPFMCVEFPNGALKLHKC